MIKRLVKKKDSKQGAILVIVVLILALAMIFITAAMMLTQATRTRLYDNTMQSQARLTVTSASEVFLEALITQEITDDQIDKMLADSPSRHDDDSDKILMVVLLYSFVYRPVIFSPFNTIVIAVFITFFVPFVIRLF